MNDAITWSALVIALSAISAIIGFWTRYSDRLTKADTKAVTAREAAEDAKKEAKAAQVRIGLLDQAFALYRERVAHEYTHKETLREAEERLTDAIDRLGDRIDRALERARP